MNIAMFSMDLFKTCVEFEDVDQVLLKVRNII